MSLFRLPNLRRIASNICRGGERFTLPHRQATKAITPRRLQIDPLEERQLLSVTPANVDDMLVSQEVNDLQTTLPARSIAVDNDGDFVVTWTRYDEVFQTDPNTGETIVDPISGLPAPIIDPTTGAPMTDANIYARYYTDELQRLTLPDDAATNNVGGSYGNVSLHYGHEMQKLEITATYEPSLNNTNFFFDPDDPIIIFGFGYQQDISATFTLGFDLNRNGVIGSGETTTVVFDEFPFYASSSSQHLKATAMSMQVGLQGLGGELTDVVVEPINPHEYLIHFGDAAGGLDQPELTIESVEFTAGFLPAVQISTVSEPIQLNNIPISPDNPALTALAIEQAFLNTSENVQMGVIDFPPPDRVSSIPWPYRAPQVKRTAMPEVSVTARSATEFDITFTGDSGKRDHPELVVLAVEDDMGNDLSGSSQLDVTTIKQSSDEFRVNPPEPEIFPGIPHLYDQTESSVAMDADGDFVITWMSEVPDIVSFGSEFDVFARRFSPIGMVEDPSSVSGFVTPGVRAMAAPQILSFDPTNGDPLVGTFRLKIGGVETGDITFNSTGLEVVAISIEEEFISAGYDRAKVSILSATAPFRIMVTFLGESGSLDQPPIECVPGTLPANISVEGDPVDLYTFRVNTNTTNAQFSPDVGMDDAGNFTIAWASLGQDVSFFNGILTQRYNRHGEPIGSEAPINTPDTSIHFSPYVELSHDGHAAITWTATDDPDFVIPPPRGPGGIFVSVFAEVYDPNGAVLLNQFNVSGGGISTAAFDMNNNFVISWEANVDTDNIGVTSEGIRAQMYDLTGNIIRSEFRANSASFVPTSNTLWPLTQTEAQAVLDADGDLIISYEGYGPDASYQTFSDSLLFDPTGTWEQVLQEQINANHNADLLPYFDPTFDSLPIFWNVYNNDGRVVETGNVDGVIEEVMIQAMNLGADDLQVGRLRAILDDSAGLLRGDAYGVMFSRFDADPQSDVLNTLFSDSIANNQRDGHNQRYVLTLDDSVANGSFVVRMWHAGGDLQPGRVGYEDITVGVVSQDDILLPYDTRDAIEAALQGAERTGVNWPDPWYAQSVNVRLINNGSGAGFGSGLTELEAREGTPWEIRTDPFIFDPTAPPFDLDDYVFEIIFQGEVHDTWIEIMIQDSALTIAGGGDAPSPNIDEYQFFDEGTPQRHASIAMEPDGDFVMAWTQWDRYTNTTYANNSIYYRQFDETTDTAGPQVTDLVDSDGVLVDNGGEIDAPVQHVVMTFDEDMMTLGEDSVLDPDNYRLLRNGLEIVDGIVGIQYGMNRAADLAGTIDSLTGQPYELSALPTNKWDVVFTLDGNGVDAGIEPLGTGIYTIEALAPIPATDPAGPRSGLRDRSGNPLNYTGFLPVGQDYARSFVVVSGENEDDPVTPDVGVNGRTHPETPGAVAVDADGDQVVAWTAFDATLGHDRVYVRVYDASGDAAATAPFVFQVTPVGTDPQFAMDTQRFGSVATDKDGDFIVTWTNFRDVNGDGVNEEQDIYARRFFANGTPMEAPFLVNTFGSNVQKWSSVAMDTDGDFVVTWSSYGREEGSGIYARQYNSLGEPLAAEFPVNVVTTGDQRYASVAMDTDGGFVVTWTSNENGTDTDVFARAFGANGTPLGGQVQVNTFALGDQKFSDIATSLSGNNVAITWSSGGDQDGDGFGTYARTFTRNAAGLFPTSAELLVNTTTNDDQKFSSVAMNHLGEFVVAWSGHGEQPLQEDASQFGVFYQRFAPNGARQGGETRANLTTAGNQRWPSVSSDGEGNFALVWTGDVDGNPPSTEVFRMLSIDRLPVNDGDGPLVTDVLMADASRTRILNGDVVDPPAPGMNEIIFVFGENVSDIGPESVLNPANWIVEHNGGEIFGAVTNVSFGLNPVSRKYETRLTLDGNGSDLGVIPLLPGNYTITVRDAITDGSNALDGDFDGLTGTGGGLEGYRHNFAIAGGGYDTLVGMFNGRTHAETPGAVAVDADGDHVVVWTSFEPALNHDRVLLRLYNADGDPAETAPAVMAVTPVGTHPEFVLDDQRFGTVAADADGDFVVTWTNFRDTTGDGVNDEQDIYARRYFVDGTPMSNPFRVNTYTENNQTWSDVAMDTDGDFVVTWASYGQEEAEGLPGYGYGIYARRFDSLGLPQGAEYRVNVTSVGHQQYPSVAMDAIGNYMVTWTSDQGGAGDDIVARAFKADGSAMPFDLTISTPGSAGGPFGGEILVNNTTDGNQRFSDVAMDLAGQNFVVTWSSSGAQDGDGWGVYMRTLQREFDGVVSTSAPETLVNTTTNSNQKFSAVTMDHQGNVVVAWSGRGEQPGQEDRSEFGVFYQRFEMTQTITDIVDDDGNIVGQVTFVNTQPVGGETRANLATEGNQWLPSLGSDGQGNFVMAWTGDDPNNAGSTQVYKMLSSERTTAVDDDGPLVTDVMLADGTRLFDGSALEAPGINQLTVIFGEALSIVGGTQGPQSVLNPDNWVLERYGVEVLAGITGISFARDDSGTRKYEAVVDFDGNGLDVGAPALPAGEYVLTVRDAITDGINALDGDADGLPGSDLLVSGLSGYRFNFVISDTPQHGPEFRINEDTDHYQTFSEVLGTGMGMEESNRSVAVDHDGDFVVVWTSYGQDDPNDPIGAGVYYRMFDRDNVPLTPERRVNTTVAGHQRDAEVAIDADGEFVIVWENEGQGSDGSYDVFARAFNSIGDPLSDEFLVNTDTTRDQTNPAIAMDDYGNFVVVFVTSALPLSFHNDIHGKLYDLAGRTLQDEFLINDFDIPSGFGTETNPAVGMDADGDFVVAWDQRTSQTHEIDRGSVVFARLFDRMGRPRMHYVDAFRAGPPIAIELANNASFVVNSTVLLEPFAGGDFRSWGAHSEHQEPMNPGNGRSATRNAQVAMGPDGDFTIIWESFQDNDIDEDDNGDGDVGGFDAEDWPDSYGIYFQRFDMDGLPESPGDVNANYVFSTGYPGFAADANFGFSQVNATVAVDANNNLAVAWNGNGAQPSPLYSSSQDLLSEHDSEGIFIREFDMATAARTPQQRSNRTVSGRQQFPSLAMEPDGDKILVWSGSGVGDSQGIFARRYLENLDLVGPIATELRTTDGQLLYDGHHAPGNMKQIAVVFDEAMSTVGGASGDYSVTNPDNWYLLDADGRIMEHMIEGITFQLNPANNKWEAVITFIDNGLPSGYYELAPSIDMEDAAGNKLRHTGFHSGSRSDELNTMYNDEDRRTVLPFMVAMSSPVGTGMEFLLNQSPEFVQTLGRAYETGTAQEHTTRSVAVDHDGDFVVVWTSYGQDDPSDTDGAGVYFRLFSRDNLPLTDELLVNETTAGHQFNPSVAMDADGDFAIVWQSEGQDPDGSSGIYSRQYNANGTDYRDTETRQVVGEFRVNTDTVGEQFNPSIGMDNYGNYVIVWATSGQLYSYFNDIYAQVYDYAGRPSGEEFQVNAVNIPGPIGIGMGGASIELNPTVALGPNGTFVVVWGRMDSNNTSFPLNTNVFARMFAANGEPMFVAPDPASPDAGSTVEFRVNVGDENFTSLADHAPHLPAAGFNDDRYTSMPFEDHMYDQIHAARNPQIAMDDLGNFVIAWESFQDNDYINPPPWGDVPDSYGVYFRPFNSSGTALFEWDEQANTVLTWPGVSQMSPGPYPYYLFADDQVNPSLAMDADGDLAIVWNGNGANVVYPALFGSDDEEGVWVQHLSAGSYGDTAGGTLFAPSSVEYQSMVNRTTYGIQQFPSVAMEPDGDHVIVWGGPGVDDEHGIFARRYNEVTDTAGPMATELRLLDGTRVDVIQDYRHDPAVASPTHLVVVFDEELWTAGDDSVTNPENWVLTRNGLELNDAIESVTFSFNPATNKWEAVIELGDTLSAGNYTITARPPAPDDPSTQQIEGQSGLRDAVGNPLNRSGFNPGGDDTSFDFIVKRGGSDSSVTNGRTYPESRGAVGVDADGDHVVVITANPDGSDLDKVYVRPYDADGNPADNLFPVVAGDSNELDFAGDNQRYASVAVDADGDFVVTWTNERGGNEDIYARRFNANGTAQGDAFRVNAYTANDQKWSNVAIDDEGDFVVTWSSFGQEDGGQLGSGYGVYARRFDSLGYPLGGEFQVNVTTAGNQQFSAVDMHSAGGFVIAWTSDQGGIGDDVIARVFNADGSPRIGPLGGEILINATTAGNQRYPDVAVTPNGNNFVVTWTSSGQDGSGDGVYARTVDVELWEQTGGAPIVMPPYQNVDGRAFAFGNTITSPVTVPMAFPDNFLIADVNVVVNILHGYSSDVKVSLKSPSGTIVELFSEVPTNLAIPSSDFNNTLLDDEAPISITDYPLAVGPFGLAAGYQPEELLSAFDGQVSSGTWELIVQDEIWQWPAPEVGGTLISWDLILERVPPMSPEILVNETTVTNQGFSSVAMNRQGQFTVTWTGHGNQQYQEDNSGDGVFYRRFGFNGDPIGGEVRANAEVIGDQRISSIDSDGEGNFVIVFTGPTKDPSGEIIPGATDVYRFISQELESLEDFDGPMVTDVWFPNDPNQPNGARTRLVDGDALISDGTHPINTLIVAFGEEMSTREIDIDMNGTFDGPGPDSVLNPNNWILKRNDSELFGAIETVEFDLNPQTRKYEARLTLSPSVLETLPGGQLSLAPGSYVLVASELINDAYSYDPSADPDADPDNAFFMGNALDGDFDGSPGVSPSYTGQPGYQTHFLVAGGPQYGAEFLINQTTPYEQRLATSEGIGYGREQSTKSVAIDHDGDFVVVWTSYGQDDPSDPSGAGVFFRLYDRNNNPLTGETLVNVTTTDNQKNPSVAMDADGDFTIVWQSEGQDADGSSGVFARRFNAVGQPLGGEMSVHSETINQQFHPDIAMDDDGNFVVVWGSSGQQFSYFNDVHGQRFNYLGQRLGSQFLVNTANTAGLPGFEVGASVAMDPAGNFVVAWDQIVAQQNGQITDSQIMAQLFDAAGAPVGAAFVADTGAGAGGADTERVARNPQLATDESGNFAMVWESFNGLDYDVFFQTFTLDTTADPPAVAPLASGPVNQLVFGGHQVNPSVAIDADGDFAVVWNGAGGTIDALTPNGQSVGDVDDNGIFIRKLDATASFITSQTRVNMTQGGIQEFPTIAIEPDGDMIVVWSGQGIGDRHGIFARRYGEETDLVGPRVTGLQLPGGQRIPPDGQVMQSLSTLVVTFDEEMMTTGPDSVTDPRNYRLLDENGIQLVGGIRNITFGLNPATNKWEAVLKIDANGAGTGDEPLGNGRYELVISNSLRDAVGNPLGGNGVTPNGAPTSILLNVTVPTSSETPISGNSNGSQSNVPTDVAYEAMPGSPQTVASDGDGDYVAVWVNDTVGQEGIFARVYDVTWNDAEDREIISVDEREILVTNDPTAIYPSVARDTDGDFVVTWSAQSQATDWDVYARRFDAAGNPLGSAFRVNSETEDVQRFSTVALDTDGDFVVTWQSFDQDGSGYGVYAQRFSAAGIPIGGVNETQVLSFYDQPTGTFKLRFDGKVTAAIQFDGNTFESASEIEAALRAIGVEVQVAPLSLTDVAVRFVGPEGVQDLEPLVVVQTALSGGPLARIVVTTQSDGAAGEFRVNDTTDNNQRFPSIAMDAEGSFIISWTSGGQDGDAAHESNIYAKQFVSNRVFQQSDGQFGSRRYAWDSVTQQYPGVQYAVSTDDPANHIVPPGAGYDGVVQLFAGGGSGTGVLLKTGRHIITAAHVVDSGGGVPVPSIDAYFDLPGGSTPITATQIFIHPDWNGDIFNANDLAIIVLPRMAPQGAERYDLYRGNDELGHMTELVGYGVNGQGAEQGMDNLKRVEYNVFEVLGEAFDGLNMADFRLGAGWFDITPDALLSYDFDSGSPANDTFGALFGINDLGLGILEGSGSHGDSGGGAFLNGKLIGVTSGGIEYGPTDSDNQPFNVSFGTSGFYTRVSHYAEWIDLICEASGPEFLVNQTTANNQKWSSVAMDADGDFVVTWTGYAQDGVGGGSGAAVNGQQGVFARRFDSDGNGLGADFQVNTFAADDQQSSQVAMDPAGNFVITWESMQDRPGVNSSGNDSADSFGVYAQRYASNDSGQLVLQLDVDGNPVLDANGNPVMVWTLTDPMLGPNGEIGGELAVNSTKSGHQRYASVAISDAGDYVIVWSGAGQDDSQGVFYQRFDQLDDTAPPTVADVLNVIEQSGTPQLDRVIAGAELEPGITQFVVTFSENLSIEDGMAGVHSVLNPNNWKITRDGDIIIGGIASIEFGLSNAIAGLTDSLDTKFQAVITFDGDPTRSGNQPLGRGSYVLTAKQAIEDRYENALDGNQDGVAGRDFDRAFTVHFGGPTPLGPQEPDEYDDELELPINDTTAGIQGESAIASNAAGDYVMVWASAGQAADGPNETNIIGRRFDRFGNPLSAEFLVGSYRTGSQIEPDVAMDEYGNFVVTWSGEGEEDTSGVFARIFDAFGVAQEDEFRVNQYRESYQHEPSVTIDGDGDFAISWTSYGQDGDRDGIIARRYGLNGRPLGSEFLVNSHRTNRQDSSDIAAAPGGNLVVVWASDGQDGSAWGVYGQRYNAAGKKVGGEFRVSVEANDKQLEPRVAVDANGNFVVTWSCFLKDGSGYGVYARRFNAAGTPRDANEFRVNQVTKHWQVTPDVGMDDAGNFVITWSTFDQDNDITDDYGIYARIYNANGSNFRDPNTGAVLGEFRINENTVGDQVRPAIAVDSDGDFVITWVGPDYDTTTAVAADTDVYSRVVVINDDEFGANPSMSLALDQWEAQPGGFKAQSLQPTGTDTVVLQGTNGDDTFEFAGGSTPDEWIVLINGVAQHVDSTTGFLKFEGLGGNDTVTFTGTNADDWAELWPDHGVLIGSGYTVTVEQVESITVYGRGGHDEVTFHDSEGDDNFVVGLQGAAMTGPGVDLAVGQFETVYAEATAGGNDVAKLYDSPGDDNFVGAPRYGQLTGDGFFFQAAYFNAVHAYATGGGNDVAKVYDSPGDDKFYATPVESALYGDGFFNRIKFFKTVRAYAGAGGTDTAELLDSAGDDTFFASPTEAAIWNGEFYNRVKHFESVNAFATAGGHDEAVLHDSPGNDTFVGAPKYGFLSGDGFANRAAFFEDVYAYAENGGYDSAKIYDSPGDDQYVATPVYGALSGDGFFNRAMYFDRVDAYASAGGYDTAKMFDSAGDDMFYASPVEGALWNDSFYTRAKNFEAVRAYAENGGIDEAHLYGSDENDIFVGTDKEGALFNDGFYNRAKFFENVHAHAGNGDGDQAYLIDAVLDDQLGASYGSPEAKTAWLYEFEECFIEDQSSDDGPIKQDIVDEILKAYW